MHSGTTKSGVSEAISLGYTRPARDRGSKMQRIGLLIFGLMYAACSPSVDAPCAVEADCAAGQICQDGACVQGAEADAGPVRVDMEDVAGGAGTASGAKVHGIGFPSSRSQSVHNSCMSKPLFWPATP